jgi:hypothetical protein
MTRSELKDLVKMFRAKGASWKWLGRRVREEKPYMMKAFYQIKQELVNG